jgi:small subunit ribosomal protein S16
VSVVSRFWFLLKINFMLTIRLARTGKRNTAQFKIMLQEKTVAPGGRHVEILGSYNPHSKEAVLKTERIKYWIEKGAFISDTVHNLLVKNNVISEKKRVVKLPKKVVVAEVEAEVVAEKIAEPKAE